MSKDLGDRSGTTYCGLRAFHIIETVNDYSSYLTLNAAGDLLTLAPTVTSPIGTFDILCEFYLVEFPTTITTQVTLQVEILVCEVQTLTASSMGDLVYDIDTGANTFAIDDFI